MTDQPTAPDTSADPLGIDPGIGHNNPPEALPYDANVLAELKERSDKFIMVSDEWMKVDINSESLAGQIGDQIDGLRSVYNSIEKAREEAKKPHWDAGKAVDAAFNPLKELITLAANKLKPKLAAYVQQKEAAAEKLKAEQEAQARQAQEAARLAALDAERANTVTAQAEAEAAAEKAKAATKLAAKKIDTSVKSASGAGRTKAARKRKVCTITNTRHLFLHYQDNEKVHEVLLALANAEANSADFPADGEIPGTSIEIKTTVA